MAANPNYIPLRLVKLKKYEELTGVSQEAFRGKIKRSQVAEGIHYKKAPDGTIWVDWQAMENWVEGDG